VEANQAKCFAVRRGELAKRADVSYASSTVVYNRVYKKPLYPLTPLRELVTAVQYGISSLASERNDGFPILRMNNLQNDGWDLSDVKYIKLSDKEANAYRVRKGDILFNRTNSKELVGKCEVFREEGHWVFASYLIRVRLDSTRIEPDFASIFFNTEAGRVQINRVSRQIIGMANINAEELRDLLIPCPTLPAQQALVKAMGKARKSREEQLGRARNLLSSIDGFVLSHLGLSLPPPDNQTTYAIHLGDTNGSRFDALYYQPRMQTIARLLNETTYKKKCLGDISPDLAGGATPSRANQELYANEGIRFLRIMNIAPNEIRMDDMRYITQEVHEGMLGRLFLASTMSPSFGGVIGDHPC